MGKPAWATWGHECVKTVMVDGVEVGVAGCYNRETPVGEFGWYEFYADYKCLNPNRPHFGREDGLDDAIRACLRKA